MCPFGGVWSLCYFDCKSWTEFSSYLNYYSQIQDHKLDFSPIHTPKIAFLSLQHFRLLSAEIRATVRVLRLLLFSDRILKSKDMYRMFNQSCNCLASTKHWQSPITSKIVAPAVTEVVPRRWPWSLSYFECVLLNLILRLPWCVLEIDHSVNWFQLLHQCGRALFMNYLDCDTQTYNCIFGSDRSPRRGDLVCASVRASVRVGYFAK